MVCREKIAIWQNRKFLIGSIIFLFLTMAVGWILYVSFGHKLIEAMYEGRSIGFLNGIIEGQAGHPIGFYFKKASELFRRFLIALIFFLLIPVCRILLINNRYHVISLQNYSDMRKRNYLFIFFFIFISVLMLTFYRQLMCGYAITSWNISEFLINYQGGFVRRGFLGEIILSLYNNFGIKPYGVILFLCTLAYSVVVVFFVRSFLKKRYPIFMLPFVFFLGNPILNNFWVRKDVLLILLFILTINFSIKKSKTYSILMNLFFIIALLTHEAIGFFCFPIALLILISKNNNLFKVEHPSIKSIFTSLLELLPSIVTFFCVLYYKGSLAISKTIWDSWKLIVFPFQAKDNHQVLAAVDALSWSLKGVTAVSLNNTLKNFNDGIYAPFAWFLILVLIYYLLTNTDKVNVKILNYRSTENFNKKNISNVLIFQFLSVIPLFILFWDYSRLVFYWVISSFAIVVLIPDEILSTLFPKSISIISSKVNIFLDSIFSKSKGFIFLLYLFLGVPFYIWILGEYIRTTPVFILLNFASEVVHQVMILVSSLL